eukprot:CAMPEP_0204536540 /NCGR_PEP_ID=MMETSP0661-20131031/14558_1 /ASSEMBLY_ACC=CAM_ASM_000606 /TAXON_ID=109239 /ORGANISM="Alexandrium margalefi, Strain AMGDE01CS-322" /LENGTH=104 /DNA_ID=CAMNT_0051543071 /DNA_START=9 /DNA_END=320 /DNA_ORIENTATION=+
MLMMKAQLRVRPSTECEPRPEPPSKADAVGEAVVVGEVVAPQEEPKQAPGTLVAGRASRAIRASGARPPVHFGDVVEVVCKLPCEEEGRSIVQDETAVPRGGPK